MDISHSPLNLSRRSVVIHPNYDNENKKRNFRIIAVIIISIVVLITFVLFSIRSHPYFGGITYTPPNGATNHLTDRCGIIKPGDRFSPGDYIINNKGQLLLITENDITVHEPSDIISFSLSRDTQLLTNSNTPEFVEFVYNCNHTFTISINDSTTGAESITINNINAIDTFISDSGAKPTCMFMPNRDNGC